MSEASALYTVTRTEPPAPDPLAELSEWEIRLVLFARDVRLRSAMAGRPVTLLARFDDGVLFLDESSSRGRIPTSSV